MPRRLDASARSARQVRLRPHRSSPPATIRHSGNDQLQPTSVPPTIAAALLRSTMRRAATPLPRYRGMPRESPLCFGRQSFCRAHKFEAKPFGGLQRGTIHQLNAGRRRVQGAECVKILPRLQVHKSAVSRPPFRRIMGPRGKRAAPRTPSASTSGYGTSAGKQAIHGQSLPSQPSLATQLRRSPDRSVLSLPRFPSCPAATVHFVVGAGRAALRGPTILARAPRAAQASFNAC